MTKLLFSALSIAIFAGLLGCTTVTETGRHQLMLVSPQEETKMGLAAFADVKAKEKQSTNPKWNDQVSRVGRRIAASVGREVPDAQGEFVVFESDQVNAFALPGGKVSVYTGLLNLVQSDDELACVMGHEIAHVTSRHGAERASQQRAAGYGAALVGEVSQESQYRDLALLAYGGFAQTGVLAYSRLHETEADSVGIRFAANAGYDPRAAITFWQRMAQASAGKSKPFVLLSTHPSDESRIENLKRLAPQYVPVYEAAKKRFE